MRNVLAAILIVLAAGLAAIWADWALAAGVTKAPPIKPPTMAGPTPMAPSLSPSLAPSLPMPAPAPSLPAAPAIAAPAAPAPVYAAGPPPRACGTLSYCYREAAQCLLSEALMSDGADGPAPDKYYVGYDSYGTPKIYRGSAYADQYDASGAGQCANDLRACVAAAC